MTHRRVVPIALVLGLLAAVVSSVAAAPRRVVARSVRPILAAGCPGGAAKAIAPSAKLLDSFSVLRRPAGPDDALPAAALKLLDQRGIKLSDPSAARVLRTGGAGGRAWVVPVGDVSPLLAPFCLRPGSVVVSAKGLPALPARVIRPATRATRPLPSDPAARRRVTRALLSQAKTLSALTRRARVRKLRPLPVPPMASLVVAQGGLRPALRDTKPQEGLVVLSTGDAAAGGGGTLKDVLAGQALPAISPCAGPQHDLVGVSGVVPDGVDAVYLAKSDGSAVRADVKDNAYAFVVAPFVTGAYLVWTGADGKPKVQAVRSSAVPGRACRSILAHPQAVVATPNALGSATAALPVGRPALVTAPSQPSTAATAPAAVTAVPAPKRP